MGFIVLCTPYLYYCIWSRKKREIGDSRLDWSDIKLVRVHAARICLWCTPYLFSPSPWTMRPFSQWISGAWCAKKKVSTIAQKEESRSYRKSHRMWCADTDTRPDAHEAWMRNLGFYFVTVTSIAALLFPKSKDNGTPQYKVWGDLSATLLTEYILSYDLPSLWGC